MNGRKDGWMDGWMNNMWYIHTVEYYSGFKRKEILAPVTTWMNLEDMMLNEVSQTQKDLTL